MSIASAITSLSGRIADAYTAIENMGGTLPAEQNSYNLSGAIETIPTGGGEVFGLPIEELFYIDADGSFSLCHAADKNLVMSGVRSTGTDGNRFANWLTTASQVPQVSFPDLEYARSYDFNRFAYANKNIRCFSAPSLNESLAVSSPGYGFCYAFSRSSLSAVNLQSYQVARQYDFQHAFSYSELREIEFPSLTLCSGNCTFDYAFAGCTKLSAARFPALKTIYGGQQTFRCAFNGCTALTALYFPALETITKTNTDSTTNGHFCNNNTIKDFYFPSLSAINKTSQFNNCTALTGLHFASANQNLITASEGYASKWGAPTATQVLFDL